MAKYDDDPTCVDCGATPTESGYCVMCGKYNEPVPAEYKDDEDLTAEEYYERYGEPRGAGADPFGRPDPQTHPEFWTE